MDGPLADYLKKTAESDTVLTQVYKINLNCSAFSIDICILTENFHSVQSLFSPKHSLNFVMETFFLGASTLSSAPIDSLFKLGIKVVPSMNLSMNV